VNIGKKKNVLIRKTSKQCKGKWNSMRKEKEHMKMKHEELKVNGLFSIKLKILLVHLPKL
jgi:hypothetical protein